MSSARTPLQTNAGPTGAGPTGAPEHNVIAHIERHRAAIPDRVALRWVEPADLARWTGQWETPLPHRQITYAELAAQMDHTARALADLGLREGDRVIIFLPMGVLMYVAMFAVQKIGAIAVFLDSWARRNHLGAGAACVQPRAMISHRAAFDLVAALPEFRSLVIRVLAGPGGDPSFSAQLEELVRREGSAPLAAVAPDDTALVTFTTGSSGVPKGANRTHRFLRAQHEALSAILPYDAEKDADLPVFPIFSLNNLACGVTTVLPALDLARPSPMDAAAIVSQVRHERITCATLSPSLIAGVTAFCQERRMTLPSLRRIVTGGAPISRDTAREVAAVAPPPAEFCVLYGATEVEPMAHITAREMLALPVNPDPELTDDGVNVGRLSAELDYKFIRICRGPVDLATTSWNELEALPGEVGELIVAGDHVCRDYYNNPEAFVRAKIVDEDGRVWHRTGDLARLDARGHLWVVGRVHNAILRTGRCHFPVQAEILLRRVPAVRQAAYLGLPDPAMGERAVVAVTLARGEADVPAARAEILRLFAKNRIPVDALFVLDTIPMDLRHHSKVEYEVLRRSILEGAPKDWMTADGPGGSGPEPD